MLPSSDAHVTNDGIVEKSALTPQPLLPQLLLPAILPPQAPAIPTPPVNRRHSHNPTARKPIRSSPLAGPALSVEDSNIVLTTNALKSSRILSSPDLPSLSSPSPVRFARPKSSQGLVPVPHASGSASSLHSPLPVYIPSRRPVSPALEHRRSKKRTSQYSQYHAEFSDCPPIPEYVPSVQPKSAHSELETQRKSMVLPATTTDTTRPDSSGSSWLTANPYEVTPRFSRLSLASPHVILPISAREHKRISKARSSLTINDAPSSGSSESKLSVSPSTPSLSFSSLSSTTSPASSLPSVSFASDNSSASSSSDSLPVLPVPPQVRLTPSVLSVCTVTEEGKSDDRSRHLFSIRGNGSTWARMRSLRLKGSKSHNDIKAHTLPSFKAFDFGSSVRFNKEAPASLKIMKSGDGTAQQTPIVTVEQVREAEAAVLSTSPKRKGTVKRIWWTISTGSWARTF